ncbi:MAG: TIGR03621 family F420-dependent LLM class oxidoreductase [Ktedonobacteraceae bacterium]|nr:TIGR03621 family F420-dependent LLM class oxidoreductase [Ktedonobacteraceae bacterium]
MAKKPFRFGIITYGNPSRSAWIALAQRAEELGYASLHVPDVLSTPTATLTTLAVAATATTTLRVGSFVLVNDYRHPALLAREIATLDQLSGGRVELGLGAGGWPLDFQQLGIPFDNAGRRVSRFEEGFSIIKQFFTSDVVNFSGKYYTVKDLHSRPRPVQQPHPPIYIGSGGRRLLTLAAREADIITPIAQEPEALEEKIGWIQEAAGERFEHLTLSQIIGGIELTDSPVAVGPLIQEGVPEEARSMTIEQAIEYLEEQREKYGFSYFYLRERQIENFIPVLTHLNGK